MTIYSIIFYLLALLVLGSTAMAITRRNLIHAVIYLILSFFGSAMLFYLFGAPYLAILEVIIYAGAIMVLFLFIVIMMKLKTAEERLFPSSQWLPAAIIGLVYIGIGAVLVISEPGSRISLKTARADPGLFGLYIFEKHWLSIEIVSLLLLVALIGALVLGLRSKKAPADKATEGEL
jgi:NADH-quinone oxidoreductase subunit J